MNEPAQTKNPADLFVRSSGTAGQWRLRAYESPGLKSSQASQDSSLVILRPDGVLRAAVIDGVTPVRATPSFLGLDGARYAAGLIRTALTGTEPIESCLGRANEALYSPELTSRAQAQATVAAVDLDPAGDAHIVRSCDCEVWTESLEGEWTCLFPSAHRAWATAAWEKFLEEHPELRQDPAGRSEAEQEIWGRPEAWESLPIGREAAMVIETRELAPRTWRRLLLTTDGLGSRVAGPDKIDALLASLEDGSVSRFHDDTTVILIAAEPIA